MQHLQAHECSSLPQTQSGDTDEGENKYTEEDAEAEGLANINDAIEALLHERTTADLAFQHRNRFVEKMKKEAVDRKLVSDMDRESKREADRLLAIDQVQRHLLFLLQIMFFSLW
jgi:hypothetical protein